jgi:hypothetical protein
MPRWGAERRARPLHEVASGLKSSRILRSGDKGARRIAFRCGTEVRLLALRLPSFKGGIFLAMLLGVAFLGLSKTRVRKGIARTDRRMSQRIPGHGAATHRPAKLSGPAYARRVADAPIAGAHRSGLARAVRLAGIVPLLRRQAVPPRAHMLWRRPAIVPAQALVPQDGEAQDAAAGMDQARAPHVVVTCRRSPDGAPSLCILYWNSV